MGKTVVIKRFDEYAAHLRAATSDGLDQAANVVVNQVKHNLSKPGRFKDFWKQASRKDKRYVKEYGFVDAPGGMPRLRTGTLRRSIVWNRHGPNRRIIGPSRDVPYGRIHELGGIASKGVYIPARPYLRPGLRASERVAARVFSSVVRARMRKVRLSIGRAK